MDNYLTYTMLLGLKDQNLPVFKEKRQERLKSVERMVNLLNLAASTTPKIPTRAFLLDRFDRNCILTQPNGMILCHSLPSTDLNM